MLFHLWNSLFLLYNFISWQDVSPWLYQVAYFICQLINICSQMDYNASWICDDLMHGFYFIQNMFTFFFWVQFLNQCSKKLMLSKHAGRIVVTICRETLAFSIIRDITCKLDRNFTSNVVSLHLSVQNRYTSINFTKTRENRNNFINFHKINTILSFFSWKVLHKICACIILRVYPNTNFSLKNLYSSYSP